MDSLKDIWNFIVERKQWILVPVIFILLLFGMLMFFAGNSVVAPFVYTLF